MSPAVPRLRRTLRPAIRFAAVLCAAAGWLFSASASADESPTVYRLQELDETVGTLRTMPRGLERLFGVIDRLTPDDAPQSPSRGTTFDTLFSLAPRADAVPVTPVLFGLPSFRVPGWMTPIGGRFRGLYANDFTEDQTIGGQLLVNTNSYLAIDAEGYRRRTNYHGGRDEFWNGDANVVFWLPKVKMLAMRTGAGAAWILDHGRTDVGWNITYGADVFIKSPWLFSGVIDYGRISSQKLFHGQATIGVKYDRFELFTGYDYYSLGQREVDGLIGGAGLWF